MPDFTNSLFCMLNHSSIVLDLGVGMKITAGKSADKLPFQHRRFGRRSASVIQLPSGQTNRRGSLTSGRLLEPPFYRNRTRSDSNILKEETSKTQAVVARANGLYVVW